MIINASGRCDICAYYSSWFMNRIRAGFVDVRNPFNPHQVSRILLDSQHVDFIVFCTKNPIPMLQYIDQISFPMLFHITLTGYHKDIEPQVPDKKAIIQAIKVLSSKIGKDRIVLRYDPIIINERYTIAYHQKAMESLLKTLHQDIAKCVISFVDMYKNTKENFQCMNIKECTQKDMDAIGEVFGKLAKQYQIEIQTCAESIDLSKYGIKQGKCFDEEELSSMVGYAIQVSKKGVRSSCACIETVDIGAYNCCFHGCLYCYANYDKQQLVSNLHQHDQASSLLLGNLSKKDQIHIRKGRSEHHQMKL